MEQVSAGVVLVKVNYIRGKFWLEKTVVHMVDCTADSAIMTVKQIAKGRGHYINPEAFLCEDYSNNQFQLISGSRRLSTVTGSIYFFNITPKTNVFDRMWLWMQMSQEQRNTEINAGRAKPWNSLCFRSIRRLLEKKNTRVAPSAPIHRRVQFAEEVAEILSISSE